MYLNLNYQNVKALNHDEMGLVEMYVPEERGRDYGRK